jgi:Mg2+ and Co2+ transporter CorA
LIALHAVTVLFERSSHPDLEIFRTFEEAISILTEKMTNSFKKFRARGFRDKADEHDEHLRAHNIRAKHKREGELAEKQNRENTSALLELRDIEDELHTLEELFDAQRDEILTMIQIYKKEDLRDLTANGLLFLNQAEDYLSDYKRHVQRMIDDVRATREDVRIFVRLVGTRSQIISLTNSCKWSKDRPKLMKLGYNASKQILPALKADQL